LLLLAGEDIRGEGVSGPYTDLNTFSEAWANGGWHLDFGAEDNVYAGLCREIRFEQDNFGPFFFFRSRPVFHYRR